MKTPALLPVYCFRTKMIGGGTSYEVLIPRSFKDYRPIAANQYATIVCRDGEEYYRLDDALRTPEIDSLPTFTDERMNAFKKLHAVAERLAIRVARRAFPELRTLKKLPTLWAPWTMPTGERIVPVAINLN